MVNDNQSSGQKQGNEKQASGQSTGTQAKQQGSEISQGASSQQGSGQASRGSQDTAYSAGAAQQAGYDQRASQRGQTGQAQRSGQGWQQPSASALQARGGPSMSPYGGYGRLYSGGPFSMMRRITDEMDRLFEGFGLGRGLFPAEFGQFGSGEGTSSLWSPHVEVSQRDGKLVISADLPGVKKEDVSVELNPDSVTIQGRREHESTANEPGYYHSERSYGSFFRKIPLPEGTDIENATATFRDGVLQIELQAPKQQSRGRMLEIKSGDTSSGTRGGDGGQRASSDSSGSPSTSGQQR